MLIIVSTVERGVGGVTGVHLCISGNGVGVIRREFLPEFLRPTKSFANAKT